MNLLIIGSGPAGMTAGIYASRAGLRPLLLTGLQEGGLMVNTTEIENYPGFPEGISTYELAQSFKKQALRFGCHVKNQEVEEVDLQDRPFLVTTSEEDYRTEALLIATGASPRKLGLESEERYTGRGVSYCATCDGFLYRGEEIAIVGGGDSALEEALFLSRFASKVYLIHRRDTLRGSKILQDRIMAQDTIQVLWDTVVRDILPGEKNRLEGLILYHKKKEEEYKLKVRGLFVAVGYLPNSQLFSPWLKVDEGGYIVTDSRYSTSIEGVFAAGDVQDPYYRQVVTACGSGAAAALEVKRYLLD